MQLRISLTAAWIVFSATVGVHGRGNRIEEDQTLARVHRVLDSGRTLRKKPMVGPLLSSFSYGEIESSAPYELMNDNAGMISGQAEKGKSGKAGKDPICKLPFFKTTSLCSACKDQKFYFYEDFGGYCDRGFSLIENYYLFIGDLPAYTEGYKSVDECCSKNSCFNPDNSFDWCLCLGQVDAPDYCDECEDYDNICPQSIV